MSNRRERLWSGLSRIGTARGHTTRAQDFLSRPVDGLRAPEEAAVWEAQQKLAEAIEAMRHAERVLAEALKAE